MAEASTSEAPSLAAHPAADNHWSPPAFPGRIITGWSMTVAPVVLAALCFLESDIYKFDGRDFLAAMAAHSVRTQIFLNTVPLAIVLLMLALIGVAAMTAPRTPRLAQIGGSAAVLGLCGPLFFIAIGFCGYQLSGPAHLAAGAYMYDQANMVPRTAMNISGPAIIVGFILLAVAAYRSELLGRSRAICLGLTALLPVGFIGAVLPVSGIGFLACTVALTPIGLAMLREPSSRS